VLSGGAQSGGDEERAYFVAVEADGVGLVVDPGAADMHRWGMGDQAFFFGVAVEAGDGAQPPGDGRRRPALGFKLAAEGLDVAAAYLEQLKVAAVAVGDELAEIERVGVAGEAAVSAEEPGESDVFRVD
jgi:hypothetical protein